MGDLGDCFGVCPFFERIVSWLLAWESSVQGSDFCGIALIIAAEKETAESIIQQRVADGMLYVFGLSDINAALSLCLAPPSITAQLITCR